jgi:hypothetical protein
MTGGQTQLGDPAKNQRLVGGLLRVLAEQDDPSGVERAVNVIVSAVHVEGMLGKSASHDLQNHGGALDGGMVILLDAIEHALSRGKIDHALATYRMSDSSALGCMLSLSFDGEHAAAENVEATLRKRLLIEFASSVEGVMG